MHNLIIISILQTKVVTILLSVAWGKTIVTPTQMWRSYNSSAQSNWYVVKAKQLDGKTGDLDKGYYPLLVFLQIPTIVI